MNLKEVLLVNKTGNFYTKKISGTKLDISFYQDLFNKIIGEKEVAKEKEPLQRLDIETENTQVYGGLFEFHKTPAFINKANSNNIDDKLNGYIVFIEYKDIVMINKSQGASGFKEILEKKLIPVKYSQLIHIFGDEGYEISALKARNTDISNTAIRNRSYEALNIKESLSLNSRGNHVIKGLTIKGTSDIYTGSMDITLDSARIAEAGSRVNFEELVNWGIDRCEQILSVSEDDKNYADTFAQPWRGEEIPGLVPTGIFLFSYDIEEIARKKNVTFFKHLKENSDPTKVEYDEIAMIFSRSYPIINDSNGYYFLFKSKKVYLNRKPKKNNKFEFKGYGNPLKDYYFTHDNKQENLFDYFSKDQNFMLSFDRPDIVYIQGLYFKNASILDNSEALLDVFDPRESLVHTTTEKDYNATSDNFDKSSIFYVVENEIASDAEFIANDDLGNEWADHIALTRNKYIKFLHSKHNDTKMAVSSFHDIMSQAQKNIGNMNSISEIERKIDSWDKKFSNSSIKKFRKGDIKKFYDAYKTTLTYPNVEKEVGIVVDFISKKDLEKEIIDLKNGNSSKHQIIQLVWLVSSVILTVNDNGMRFKVYCKP